MKEIKLTQGKVAIVDDEDYERLMAMGKWYASVDGCTFYATKNIKLQNGKRSTIKMHRLILGLNNPKVCIDHINNNGLDNTRKNLRVCIHAENLKNRNVFKNSKSGLKGVTWHKQTKRWQAGITINEKWVYLGLFACPIEAARAYNAAALIHHGEFARLNEIPA